MKSVVIRVELKPNDNCDKNKRTLANKTCSEILYIIGKEISNIDMTEIYFDMVIGNVK